MIKTAALCFGLMAMIVCVGCDGPKKQTKKKKNVPSNRMARWHASQRNPSKDFSQAKKVPALLEKLKMQSPRTRIQACKDLGKIGHDAKFAIKQLGKMKRGDTNDGVRRAAASAIDQIIKSMKTSKPPHPAEVVEYHRKQAEGL